METDIANTIKFRDICKMMERVKAAKNTQRKELILRRYYESFCKHRTAFRQSVNVTAAQAEDGRSSFYSVLRLLIPSADRGRDNYGLQITALGRLYTRVLQLPKDSDDATRLMHRSWSSFRDYGDVVHAVLLPRCFNAPSNLTLKQIHEMLDLIANEDTTIKERELIRFTELASPEEQKWLIRILLKSMGLGIGEQRIFGLLDPLAKDMYQRCTDLGRICNLLADNKLTLSADAIPSTSSTMNHPVIDLNTFIEPFQQIRPMLCERFPGKIEELMQSDVLYLERKMDGERFQLHYARNRFKYISRNGADYTRSFGDSYEHGTLTPDLRTLLPLGMESIILDGEMMIWDTQQLRYREKGENTDVKHLKPDRSWRPCFVVYDLLYLNGESLLDMTYVQRAYKLQELLNEQQGVLQIMKGEKISSLEHFNQLFQQMLDSNAEGIVLKKQNSIYKPGVRVGGGWYKDKADYIEGLITEFDVLIIGGFYNRKRTFIESFLLGVLKPAGEHGRDEVYSIGCVANNSRQRAVLHHELKPHWHESGTEPPPLWYHYKPNEKEGSPDVWIQPDKSIVLQVKAADLTPNGAFYTAKSLHFPRTQLMRDDKVWNECMTLQEYTELCQGRGAIKKLNKRHVDLSDFTSERKRQKMTPSERSRLGLAAYEKRYDAQPLVRGSQLFDGFSFCILSGRRGHSKQQLQSLAAQNGGTIVQNPLPNDPKCICICGDRVYLVERLMKQQPRTNDILRLDWLLRVCEKQQIELRPKDVLSATSALQAQFDKSFDKLGDSYTDVLCSVEELQEVLEDITDQELNDVHVGQAELDKLQMQLLGDRSINIFAKFSGCFYNRKADELARLLFMQHGGQLADEANGEVTHVFVCPDRLHTEDFEQWHRQHFGTSNVKTVITDWIRQSHGAKRALPTTEFIFKL
ncbi:DNA ligase 4 [Drosophila sulfurigaster albostrigata]|uniref:DNA ligase 4 n=1 Tax=Drosophila sulfurigaster albostrigata TaxID=89887 RepID=UPI002D21E24F|nr:DNA ligase 4 [Drosophila sulfurigaster albostrigata]XP_062139066.1 DNA ligase 4 [Drosophila sulfurigaster albostrigata]